MVKIDDPSLSRFLQADSLIPGAGNPLAWDRYAYTLNAPTRYTDPSGQMVADDLAGGCGIPACFPSNPSKVPFIGSNSEDKIFLDKSVGDNNFYSPSKGDLSEQRPSVNTLIAIGIPLTIAIVIVELGLTSAEISIAMATLADPTLAPLTVPLELLLVGASLTLIDIDIAYWSYTYRVAFAPESEEVKFIILPPWGFR